MRARARSRAVCLLAGLLVEAAAAPAFAGAREQCVAAAERGQDLRDAGQLLAARDEFVACAREACPAVVRAECARWLAAVEDRTPSVVLRVRDRDGRDLAEARVAVDGKALEKSPDGRGLKLDPGPHAVALELAGFAPSEVRLVAREGEQDRLIDVVLEKAAGAPTPVPVLAEVVASSPAAPPVREVRAPRPFPAAPAILAGVAVAGAGAFAGLALSATHDVDTMRKTCAPGCSSSQVDAAKAKALWGNVSLGAGVVAAGAATWMWFRRDATREPAAVRWDVAPVGGGALCSVAGRF